MQESKTLGKIKRAPEEALKGKKIVDESLLHQLVKKRICIERDKNDNESIDSKGLDHGQTDNKGRHDLTGYSGIPCSTLCCTS